MMKFYNERFAVRLVLYMIFIYIFLFCLTEFNMFNYFEYNDFDLAIYNQITWNTLHGKFFYSSIRGGVFQDHIPLILLAILPLYAIFQSSLTLLFLQGIFLGLAAWPLFLIAREELGIKFCLPIVFLYLIYPALGYLNLFEFHPETFSVFFLLFTFYYFKKNNFKFFTLFMILSLACKEDVSLVILMFGIYAALIGKSRRWIFIPFFTGIFWLMLSIFIIIPYFNKNGYFFTIFYSHLGNNLFEIIKTMAFHPVRILKFIFSGSRVQYLIHLFMPVSFLSLFDLPTFLILLPSLLRNLLSQYPPTYSIYYQYTTNMIPFIFISAIYGLKKILLFKKLRYPGILLVAILLVGLLSGWILGPQLHLYKKISRYRKNYQNEIKKEFISMVPVDASVVATFRFLPKLSQRRKIYTFHYIYFGREKVEKKKFILPSDTEYALIDFEDYLTFYNFYTPQGARNTRIFLEEGNWGIVRIVDNIALLRRNYISNYKLYELIKHPIIQNKREAIANNQLAFLGYDIDKKNINGSCLLHISLYWKCLSEIRENYKIAIEIFDDKGMLVLQRLQDICYNIYPTSEWHTGEFIKGNYWLLLPIKGHVEGCNTMITLLEKDGRAVFNISFKL